MRHLVVQESLKVELPVNPESASRSREALAEFRGRLDREAFVDLRLIISELVADAVRAAQEPENPIALEVELRDGHIQVDVRDGAEAYELGSRRPELGERGWGVQFARILAQHWGSRHEGDRGRVWAQMPLAGAA
jgi:anti-sigma regulatory factor (Ser/Thr protein kinase)